MELVVVSMSPMQVRVKVDAKLELQRAATERGISVRELCKRLLTTIAEHKLCDAILDDK